MVLSLQEAADQAGTSKVDIWRAVRSGLLPAEKTHDGGFAVNSAELFRVFERRQPEQMANAQELTASPEPLARTEPAAASRTTDAPETATSDITDAFAALEIELKGLLGPLAQIRGNRDVARPEPE